MNTRDRRRTTPRKSAMCLAISALLAGNAYAACTNNTPASNETVTCTGTDTQGVVSPTATNVTVAIEAGSSIEIAPLPGGNEYGVAVRTGTITNSGTITVNATDGGWGLGNFGPGEATIVNNGSIESLGGINHFGIRGTGTGLVRNNGSILRTGAAGGVMHGHADDGLLVLENNGTMVDNATGTHYAMLGTTTADGSVRLLNNGLITTSAAGVDALRASGVQLELINGGTGVITTNGVFANGMEVSSIGDASFRNDGRIETLGNDASGILNFIDFGPAVRSIVNTGTIETSGTAAAGIESVSSATLDNSGTILVTGAGSDGMLIRTEPTRREAFDYDIQNTGAIHANDGFGVHVNWAGGLPSSTIDLFNAQGAEISGTDGSVMIDNGIVTFVNAGQLTGDVDLRSTTGQGSIRMTLVDTGDVEGNLTLLGPNTVLTLTGSGTAAYSDEVSGATTFSVELNKTGSGLWVLDVVPGSPLVVDVREGELRVNTALNSPATVLGGTLSGSGSLRRVHVVSGAISPGQGLGDAGTLTTLGLVLSGLAEIHYDAGPPGVVGGANDLLQVNGGLTLDGRVDVNGLGSFGPGVYRLINYTGVLTNNGLEIGTVPVGVADDYFVQTAIASQINLINSAGLTMRFWDGPANHDNGAIEGDNGVWDAANRNWTQPDGSLNGHWDNGQFAVFGGAPGTVQIMGEQAIAGMQFVADYVLDPGAGGALRVSAPDSVIRVDSGMRADLNTAIVGSGGLVKTDAGTLVLNAANTYTGGTALQGGTVVVSNDANLGDAAGSVTLDGGTLQNTNSFASDRDVTIGTNGGTVRTDVGLVLSGTVSGPGTLVKEGTAAVELTGINSYGGTDVLVGTLIGNSDSISGDLANAGAVIFDQVANGSFLGVISGTGTIDKINTGTLSLGGTSTYTGATNVQAGTLLVEGQLGDTATTVANAATLGGSGTILGDVTVQAGAHLAPGSGGAGTLTVGSLSLDAGAQLDYDLGQAGVIGGGVNDLIEIAGNLELDGTLNVADAGGFGAGVYRLMNYSGTLTDNTLDLGTLPAGFSANDLSVQTAIANQVNLVNTAGASLNFWDGAAGPQDDGVIQGGDGQWVASDRSWTDAGGAVNGPWNEGFAVFGGAAGTVTVQGAHNFTGMQFMTDGYRLAAGTNAALNADGATNFRVDPNVTATIEVPITGTAHLTKVDAGTLVLRGASSYTGGVSVNGGRLVGDTSNLLGNIANQAQLEFAQGTDAGYTGTITGTGAVIKSVAGTLTFATDHGYTGGTSIEEGTLQIGDGGTTGHIVGNVAIGSDAALVFDRSNDIDFAGTFSGAGTLDKFGAGTLHLTGDSGAYAGQATLHTGAMQVDGTLGGALDVLAGTTLRGGGTLGSVDNAGTVSPDQRLRFTGDYVQRDGSTYQVDIAPNGSSDLLDIAGTATIEGGEVFVVKAPGQYAGGTRYTIVDADGGVVGTYDALDQNLPFLNLSLGYDANHVYLNVARSNTDFGSLCGSGATFNQCEVAKTIDAFDATTPPTADLGGMVEQLTTMDSDGVLAAFDRMSGEAHASLAGIVLEGHALYGQTVSRRMAERREAEGATRLQGGSWARAYGGSSELGDDGNAHAADWNLHGLAVGFDTWGSENWLIGASLNAMRLDADFRPGDSGEVDAKNVALYTSFQGERAYLDGVFSYAWWDNEVTRAVEVGEISRTAASDYTSHRFATYLEGGWTFDLGASQLQPMVTLQYDRLASQAFREDGAQDLSLIAHSDSVERLTTGLGARWSMPIERGEWTFEPMLQARWLHSQGDEFAEFDVAFAGAPDISYRAPEFGWRVRGVTLPKNRAVAGVGFAARKDNLDLFVDYTFQSGEGLESHDLSAGLRYHW